MMENVDLNEFPMPVRKKKEIKHTSDYMLKKISLEVNYLTIDIKTSNLQIYHYDVNFSPEAAKYLFRYINFVPFSSSFIPFKFHKLCINLYFCLIDQLW